MSIGRPFHRNYRGMKNGPNSGFSQWAYITDSSYAESPEKYIRGFQIIQDDLEKLFQYVEPSNASLDTYSYRIHELLMRCCIEIEANFKAILSENIYSGEMHMGIYKKIEKTHHLSRYEVSLPIWDGGPRSTKPFDQFAYGAKPEWWNAYNASKHNRTSAFNQANFKQLIGAVSALIALLSSQFRTEEFSRESQALRIDGYDYYGDGKNPAIGELFRVGFPDDWSEDEVYEFDWDALKDLPDRFQKINYNDI